MIRLNAFFKVKAGVTTREFNKQVQIYLISS